MGKGRLTAICLCLALLSGCAGAAPEEPTAAEGFAAAEEPAYEGYVDRVTLTAAGETASAQPPEERPTADERPIGEEPDGEKAAEGEEEPVSRPQSEEAPAEGASAFGVEEGLRTETEELSEAPAALPETLEAEASGILVHESDRAVIDYSHTDEGYVMVRFTGSSDKRLRTQVKGPGTTYTYDLKPGRWEVFPLSDGNGSYQVCVYENVKDTSYALVTSVSFSVMLYDEFVPYLLPNQYVNYHAGSQVVAKAAALAGGEPDTLKKVELVYDFVVGELTYDGQKAASVKSGYVPVLDTVLAEKKGICFDYAALMAAMLRSQGVPCKLVVGYAGTAYHAWISVWSPETGWVDGAVFFDGLSWQRMDPTFASSGNKSEAIMKFIGDGKNYTAKYLY